ncbi:hypothetical protein C2869_02970 [Saccharobesus litoralis]|uniref:Uncharacterized protein n=1 Tax=Saccharobesus litoralis TaxID=2172099 RepID=A0A2S0VMZ5_9ALTE|nr:tetratricopeptide repeat protein [Saccharobesus litoralis]AWB65460.1 hypothetical protein C2869_02970 [Saccharobesus litoralis]
MRNTFHFVIFYFLVAIPNSYAEQTSNHVYGEVQELIKLATNNKDRDVDAAKRSLSKALTLLQSSPNKPMEFQILVKLAMLATTQNDLKAALTLLQKAEHLYASNDSFSATSKFIKVLAKTELLFISATINQLQQEYDKAIHLLDDALQVIEENGNNPALLQRAYNSKGDVYLASKQHKLAIRFYLLANYHVHTQPDNIKAKLWQRLAFAYTRINENFAAIKYFKQLLILHEQSNNLEQQAKVLLNISRSYKKGSAFGEALSYGNRALKISKETANEEFTLKSLLHLSTVYRRLSSFDNALDCGLEALNIYQKNRNVNGIATSLNTVGLAYRQLNQRDKATLYFEQVLRLPTDKLNKKYYAAALRELGLLQFYDNAYAQALALSEQAFVVYSDIGDEKGQATIKKNLGLIYQAKGQYQLAFESFNYSVITAKQTGDLWEQASNLANIATLYANTQPAKTQAWANQGLRIAIRIQAKPIITQIYSALSIAAEKRGDLQQALDYAKRQITKINEMKSEVIKKRESEAQVLINITNKMYELDQLKNTMSTLTRKLQNQTSEFEQLKHQANNDQSTIRYQRILLVILSCCLMLGISIVILKFNRNDK